MRVINSLRACVLLGALALATASCGSNDASTFPPGLEPLRIPTSSRPAAGGGQQCAEAINTTTGETSEFSWATGRGCVHGTAAQVWAAVIDPEVGVDRRRVVEFSVMRNVETGYPVSFRTHNIVRDIITLEFDLTWRLAVTEGTEADPRLFSGRYQKTFGSTFVEIIACSVVGRQLDNGVMELELVRHLKGTGVGQPEAELYLRDWFASIVARVHGRPLPAYR